MEATPMDKNYRTRSPYVDKMFQGTREEYFKLLSESCTLYVANIPKHVREERLWNLFKLCGDVKKIIYGVDNSYVFVGFVFVVYETTEDANKALKFMSGIKIDGKHLKIDKDVGYTEERRFGRGEGGQQLGQVQRKMYKR